MALTSSGSDAKATWSAKPGSGPFRVSFHARLLSLGSADSSTGDLADFRIEFAGGGESRCELLFLRDRLNPLPRYKVWRTDDKWHSWEFRCDPRAGRLESFRDGLPIGLHGFALPENPVLSFIARGSRELSAQVEIRSLRLDPWPTDTSAGGPARSARSSDNQAQWPVWRRDSGNSAVVAQTSDLAKVRLVDRIPVPGGGAVESVLLDLDGDGAAEAVVAGNGRLEAFRADGSRLWSRRLENPVVWGLHDLDGDRKPELLVAAGNPSQLHVCDPVSGQTRYVSPHRERYGVAGVKVGRLIPGSKGLQVVHWGHLDDTGVVLRFDQGVERGALAWTFDWKETFFTPLVALADMRRAGGLDLVVVTYNHVFVYAGDGTPILRLEWPSGRNYGSLRVVDIDNDGYPDIVVMADVLREHVAVLKNEQGRGLKVLWDRFVEQNYPEDHASLRVSPEAVGDFDGDGRTEVVWSVFDDRVDGRWRTVVVDAASGRDKKVVVDRWLADIVPASGGASPRLVLSKPVSREVLAEDALYVHDVARGRETVLPRGTLVRSRSMMDHGLDSWTQVSGISTGVPIHAGQMVGGEFKLEFRAKDGGSLTRLRPDAADFDNPVVTPVPGGLRAFRSGGVSDDWLAVDDSGAVHWSHRGRSPRRIGSPAGTIVQPVVARLRPSESPRIVFVDPKQTVHCVAGDTGRTLWSVPGRGCHSFYIPHSRPGGIPVVADVDGDGAQEVLVSRGNFLYVLDHGGVERRRWRFPGPPMLWATGNFLGDGVVDLAVAWERGAVLDMETVIVSGKTGRIVHRMHGGNGPFAVADINGDGRDDIVTRDLYERRTWSGRSGTDILPVEMLAGYHTPILPPGKFQGIWWSGGSWATSYDSGDGAQRWMHPFAPSGTGCVADIDGDGRLEAVGASFGNIYALPVLKPIDGPDKSLVCWDALDGSRKWVRGLGSSTTGIVAADVDGDSRPEFVMGLADGRVIAVGSGGSLRWERSVPGSAGVPVIADVTGDGDLDCLVPCADGHLYLFSGGRR